MEAGGVPWYLIHHCTLVLSCKVCLLECEVLFVEIRVWITPETVLWTSGLTGWWDVIIARWSRGAASPLSGPQIANNCCLWLRWDIRMWQNPEKYKTDLITNLIVKHNKKCCGWGSVKYFAEIVVNVACWCNLVIWIWDCRRHRLTERLFKQDKLNNGHAPWLFINNAFPCFVKMTVIRSGIYCFCLNSFNPKPVRSIQV